MTNFYKKPGCSHWSFFPHDISQKKIHRSIRQTPRILYYKKKSNRRSLTIIVVKNAITNVVGSSESTQSANILARYIKILKTTHR